MKNKSIPIFPTDLVDFKAARLFSDSVSINPPTKNELKKILSFIDLTSLEGSDTPDKIKILCKKAIQLKTASVCVYPVLVKTAKKALKNTSIKCASVAGGFPSGQTSLKIKKAEVQYAIDEGADEIDFVISRNLLLQNNFKAVFDEVAQAKEVCREKIKLKAILETGELNNAKQISIASTIALQAGADFIKTSTGKTTTGATLEAVCIMLYCIKNHYEKTGKKAGIKPSGSISDTLSAAKYLRVTKNILGEAWINKDLFRFGGSKLADVVASKLS